jgi:hypothetical protein
MLIIQIALGVFIGGLFLLIYKAHKDRMQKIKQKKLDDERLVDELLEQIKLANEQTLINYIEVFKSRLLTLEDDVDCHFYDAGVIEYNIFTKHADELKEKSSIEAASVIKSKSTDLDTRTLLIAQSNILIESIFGKLKDDAMLLMLEKISEINTKNTENNNKILLNKV